jgi:hypothetical protein
MNQVGPVFVIACGILLGYVILTGRSSQFMALLSGSSSTTSTTNSSGTPTATTSGPASGVSLPSTIPGGVLS